MRILSSFFFFFLLSCPLPLPPSFPPSSSSALSLPFPPFLSSFSPSLPSLPPSFPPFFLLLSLPPFPPSPFFLLSLPFLPSSFPLLPPLPHDSDVIPGNTDDITALALQGKVVWLGTRGGYIILLDSAALTEGREVVHLGLQHCGEGRVKNIVPLVSSKHLSDKLEVRKY